MGTAPLKIFGKYNTKEVFLRHFIPFLLQFSSFFFPSSHRTYTNLSYIDVVCIVGFHKEEPKKDKNNLTNNNSFICIPYVQEVLFIFIERVPI